VIESIISELDVEIARFQKVRALLVNGGPKRSRPTKTACVSPIVRPPTKKRVPTPDVKERTRQGQIRRWPVAKKAANKSSKATPQK
jgi:hypothetical protein